MIVNKTRKGIIKILFKDFSLRHSISSLSQELKITRVGAWKALKNLEKEKYVLLKQIGKGKTSTYIVELNRTNILLENVLMGILLEEAQKNQRWLYDFSEIEKFVNFSIIYGSILNNPKEANDIDILSIVSNKKNFIELDNTINKIQKTQIKKIHAINMTQEELKTELKKGNRAFIDAIKKGIILFKQENFIKFIKSI